MKKQLSVDQEAINDWGHAQLYKFKFNTKLAFKKTKVLSKAVINRDWGKDIQNIENAYSANKALLAGASKNIPYSTLIIIGKTISNRNYQKEMKKILQDNVIVIEGYLVKLDDQNEQKKIRRALKSFEFSHVNNFAA